MGHGGRVCPDHSEVKVVTWEFSLSSDADSDQVAHAGLPIEGRDAGHPGVSGAPVAAMRVLDADGHVLAARAPDGDTDEVLDLVRGILAGVFEDHSEQTFLLSLPK